jgi:hypothetical protein
MVIHDPIISVEQGTSGFNPVRGVWFPLDISNASSFNLLMAHSASQMAYVHTKASPWRMKYYIDALTYKTEAIKLLNVWMSDSQMAICDNAFAAVLRLLTFEVGITKPSCRPRQESRLSRFDSTRNRQDSGSGSRFWEPRFDSKIFGVEPGRFDSNLRFHKRCKQREARDMHKLCSFACIF